jgi:hypothetical protein
MDQERHSGQAEGNPMIRSPRTLDETMTLGLDLNATVARMAGANLEQAGDVQKSSIIQAQSRIYQTSTQDMARRTNENILGSTRKALTSDLASRLSDRSMGIADSHSRFDQVFRSASSRIDAATAEAQGFYQTIRDRYDGMVSDVRRAIKGADTGFWASVSSVVSSTTNILTALGVDTRFMTPRGAIAEAGTALARVREDRSAAYHASAAGLGITPHETDDQVAGVTGGIAEYLASVRSMRQSWPSLAGEIDGITQTLRRSLPLANNRELFRMADNARRWGFATGRSASEGAREIGDVARLYHENGDAAVRDLVYINELGKSFVEMTGVNIDLEEFRNNTMNLGRLALPLNISIRQAAELSFRYADSLQRGAISIQDIMGLISGYMKGGEGRMEWLAASMLKDVDPTGPNKELVNILRPYAGHYEVAGRVLEIIATRDEQGYNEAGIADKWADSERLQTMVNSALKETIDKELSAMNIRSQSDWNYWREQLYQKYGALSAGYTPDEALAIMNGGDPFANPKVKGAEAAASKYTGAMAGWQAFVDQNQNQTEDVVMRINNWMASVFDQIVDVRTWASQYIPGVAPAGGSIPQMQGGETAGKATGVPMGADKPQGGASRSSTTPAPTPEAGSSSGQFPEIPDSAFSHVGVSGDTGIGGPLSEPTSSWNHRTVDIKLVPKMVTTKKDRQRTKGKSGVQ